MSSPSHYIACDLGAESGRVILGTLENGRITIEEIHRFPTGASSIQGSLRWDILRMDFSTLVIADMKPVTRAERFTQRVPMAPIYIVPPSIGCTGFCCDFGVLAFRSFSCNSK